jgi:hypothetical protein
VPELVLRAYRPHRGRGATAQRPRAEARAHRFLAPGSTGLEPLAFVSMQLEHERRENGASWRGRQAARTETVIDAGVAYRPGDPVRVRVVRRERRTSVTDDGAAISKAGRPPSWREAAGRLERELDVNFSQRGVVSLPVVAAGPGVEAIVQRIAAASLAFYQELLELDAD